MAMRINNIGYLLKEGIRGIFLHSFASIAAICVTVACLLIVGGFASLSYNLGQMIEEVNDTHKVLVYVDEKYTDAEARSVTTPINKLDNVLKTTFIPREQALQNFIENQGGGDAFNGIDANPFRHRIQVDLKDSTRIEETVRQLEKVPGVVKISAAYELAEGFNTLQSVLTIVSVVVIAVLLVVSLLIISNTVKLAMYDRRDEITIMKMVGTTNGFIRLPYVVEGFILGMLGAGFAFALMWLLYEVLRIRLDAVDTLNMLQIAPFVNLLPLMLPTFLGAGLFVGVVGSGTSIKRFLNV